MTRSETFDIPIDDLAYRPEPVIIEYQQQIRPETVDCPVKTGSEGLRPVPDETGDAWYPGEERRAGAVTSDFESALAKIEDQSLDADPVGSLDTQNPLHAFFLQTSGKICRHAGQRWSARAQISEMHVITVIPAPNQ
jgi:hypothetical protein